LLGEGASDEAGPPIGGVVGKSSDCTAQETKFLRLTPVQLQRTAETLLGPLPDATAKLARQLKLDERRYQVSIYEKDFTDEHVTDLFEVSEELAAAASHPRWQELESCLSESPEGACVEELVGAAGLLAFRRPLTEQERTEYAAHLKVTASEAPPRTAVEDLISLWLLSPHFLHRPELSETPNSFEVASQLSYALSDGPPDERLLELAAEGTLVDGDVLAEEVRRLLASPSSDVGLLAFVEQWLELDELHQLGKAPEAFPDWDLELQRAMRTEIVLVAREVLLERRGQPRDLLSVDFTYVNGRLAELYGVPGEFGDEFERITLPEGRRGVLSLAGFLAKNAHASQTDIVHRGLFVRTEVLCSPVGAPPPNAAAVPPEVDEFSTQREKLETVHSVDGCANCHRLIDPLGYAFEHFDPIGRYRSDENGHPIDASGVVLATSQGDLDFEGATGLSTRLTQLEEVDSCLLAQLYGYVLGRKANKTDYCVLLEAETARKAGSFLDGVVALLRADSARPRVISAEGDSKP
jgi:hypothetical protein